jgi:hypothetical protein
MKLCIGASATAHFQIGINPRAQASAANRLKGLKVEHSFETSSKAHLNPGCPDRWRAIPLASTGFVTLEIGPGCEGWLAWRFLDHAVHDPLLCPSQMGILQV